MVIIVMGVSGSGMTVVRDARPATEPDVRGCRQLASCFGIAFKKSVCGLRRAGLFRSTCGQCQPPGRDRCGVTNYQPPTRLINEIGVEARNAVTPKRMKRSIIIKSACGFSTGLLVDAAG